MELAEAAWQQRLSDLALVRQQDAVYETPIVSVPAPGTGNEVQLKFEHLQRIRSFKIRGAMMAMGTEPEALAERGVVADSGGNHAQAVALAGRMLGIPARIIMASIVPEGKQRATLAFGATDGSFSLDVSPPTFVDAKAQAKAYAAETGAYYLSPYDDEAIIRGTATVLTEIIGQLSSLRLPKPKALHVPVGGGGLIGGIADVNAERDTNFALYGHSFTGADSAARSLHTPQPVPIDDPNVLAEGLSVQVVGDAGHQRMKDGKITGMYTSALADVGQAFNWYRKTVLPELGVDIDDESAVWENLPELSSMVAVAGLFNHLEHVGATNETHLAVISGGNIDRAKIQKALAAA